MCLILLALDIHPRYPVVIAANRDEFFDRPSDVCTFWHDHPNILAGRDRRSGGTWLGISNDGRFAAVTNYREVETTVESPRSRGLLVSDFLCSNVSPSGFCVRSCEACTDYEGFNLLVGHGTSWSYLSNRGNAGPVDLKSGLYGLSNHLLDTPWPKVENGKEALSVLLKDADPNPYDVLDMLHDTHRAPDENLPETGFELELERALSARFIRMDGYGTRCSSVIFLDQKGVVRFIEQTFEYDSSVRCTEDYELYTI